MDREWTVLGSMVYIVFCGFSTLCVLRGRRGWEQFFYRYWGKPQHSGKLWGSCQNGSGWVSIAWIVRKGLGS
jgi:hypothetical protein